MLVYVLNAHGKPFMPCKPAKAKKLLRNGKAKVISRMPFVIQLLFGSSGYKQKVVQKLDSGSKTVGTAAVRADGKVLYASEIKTRTDIPEKMAQRLSYRRTRRGRKTRYRAPRFDNRARTDNWLTPTIRSKIQTHIREIKYTKSILPICDNAGGLIIETATFDIHKITNPDVANDLTGKSYQTGRQKGFYNTKAFILSRDNYECKKCCGKKNNPKLHVHHIIFRSNGGTNSPDNLITLCESCHNTLHAHKTPEKESLKLQTTKHKNTTDATHVSTIATALEKTINFTKAYGYETKYNREILELPKAHFVDAMCVGLVGGEIVEMPEFVFKKVCVARGDYQRTRGRRSEQQKPKGKTCGFSRYDKVLINDTVGFVRARMSTGYAILMDIDGKEMKMKPMAKFSKMKKLAAKSSVLCHFESTKKYLEVQDEKNKARNAA